MTCKAEEQWNRSLVSLCSCFFRIVWFVESQSRARLAIACGCSRQAIAPLFVIEYQPMRFELCTYFQYILARSYQNLRGWQQICAGNTFLWQWQTRLPRPDHLRARTRTSEAYLRLENRKPNSTRGGENIKDSSIDRTWHNNNWLNSNRRGW